MLSTFELVNHLKLQNQVQVLLHSINLVYQTIACNSHRQLLNMRSQSNLMNSTKAYKHSPNKWSSHMLERKNASCPWCTNPLTPSGKHFKSPTEPSLSDKTTASPYASKPSKTAPSSSHTKTITPSESNQNITIHTSKKHYQRSRHQVLFAQLSLRNSPIRLMAQMEK